MPTPIYLDRRFSAIDWHGEAEAYAAAYADFEHFRGLTGEAAAAGTGGVISAGGLSLRPYRSHGVTGWLVRQPYRWSLSLRVRP
jgi:hypothetical protein